jgi:membrane associated rhomboid family serine protease
MRDVRHTRRPGDRDLDQPRACGRKPGVLRSLARSLARLLARPGSTAYLSVSLPRTARVTQRKEPIFNVPAAVVAIVVVCAVIHLARVYVLSDDEDIDFLLTFAFIPARYDSSPLFDGTVPGGWAADVWTFITYAFIHGDITHLAVNTVWLLPFGAAVARRFGTLRFLAFFAVTAVAGALAHLVTHLGAAQPMIGASAAISGLMAAQTRFAFQRGGPLSRARADDDVSYHIPAGSLMDALQDKRVVVFLAAWFGVNLVFGVGATAMPGMEQQEVAWQAHIGGFLAGFILFAWFDPIAAQRRDGDNDDGGESNHGRDGEMLSGENAGSGEGASRPPTLQ